MMNVTEIRKYAKLMQELGLTALEITEDARTVRLERSVPVQQKEIIPVDTTEPAACVASEKTVKNQDEYSVTSLWSVCSMRRLPKMRNRMYPSATM